MLDMLAVATGAIETTGYRDDRLRAAASNPALLATEAADYLVRKGVPFRQAHDAVGKILKEADRQQKGWTELPLDELRKISSAFDSDFWNGLTVEAALASKKVPGGTSEDSVRAAIADLESRWSKETSTK
jgi:argininosuccinate lyase